MTDPSTPIRCPVCRADAVVPVLRGSPSSSDTGGARTDAVPADGPAAADHACRQCHAQYADTYLLPLGLDEMDDTVRVTLEFAMVMLGRRISYAPPAEGSLLARALAEERRMEAGEISHDEFVARVGDLYDEGAATAEE